MSEFAVEAAWSAAAKEGTLGTADARLSIRHTGAPSLGGSGTAPNPEELLLAAVSACFVQTWAIFLAKLQVPIEEPVVDASCEVEKDPAGGFRVSTLTLAPRIPAALWDARRVDVEKTLALAEKYCITSKAVRGSVALTVTARPV